MQATISANKSGTEMGRRDFLRKTGAAVGAVAMTGFPFITRGAAMTRDAIVRLDLVEGIEALRSGTISSHDYCVAALEQAAKFEDHNIFTQISPDYVQSTAITRYRGDDRKGFASISGT